MNVTVPKFQLWSPASKNASMIQNNENCADAVPTLATQFTALLESPYYAAVKVYYDGIWEIERADVFIPGRNYVISVIVNEERGWMETWDNRTDSKCLVGTPRYVDIQELLLTNAVYQGPNYLPNGQVCQAWLSQQSRWPLAGSYISCFIGNVPNMITYIPGSGLQNATFYVTSFVPNVQSSYFDHPQKCLI